MPHPRLFHASSTPRSLSASLLSSALPPGGGGDDEKGGALAPAQTLREARVHVCIEKEVGGGRDGDVVVATGRGLGAKEAREGRASARKRGVGRSFATRGLRKCISCVDHLFHSLYTRGTREDTPFFFFFFFFFAHRRRATGAAAWRARRLVGLTRPRSDPRSDGSRAAGGRRGVAPGVRRTTGPSSSLEAHASATSAAAEAASASAE